MKAEIVQILTKDHIKYLKNEGAWPKEFQSNESSGADAKPDDDRDMFPSSDETDEEDEEKDEPN